LDATGCYRTFALPSADAMFKLAERIKPDLILLDVAMPEMDGFAAMECLKTKEDLKSIPVIFLTAKSDKDSVMRGVKMGAHGYIAKPFTPHDLLMRIDSITDAGWLDKEVDEIVRAQRLKRGKTDL